MQLDHAIAEVRGELEKERRVAVALQWALILLLMLESLFLAMFGAALLLHWPPAMKMDAELLAWLPAVARNAAEGASLPLAFAPVWAHFGSRLLQRVLETRGVYVRAKALVLVASSRAELRRALRTFRSDLRSVGRGKARLVPALRRGRRRPDRRRLPTP
jgi:hypothetical protein